MAAIPLSKKEFRQLREGDITVLPAEIREALKAGTIRLGEPEVGPAPLPNWARKLTQEIDITITARG